jgi:hypothetical protein
MPWNSPDNLHKESAFIRAGMTLSFKPVPFLKPQISGLVLFFDYFRIIPHNSRVYHKG